MEQIVSIIDNVRGKLSLELKAIKADDASITLDADVKILDNTKTVEISHWVKTLAVGEKLLLELDIPFRVAVTKQDK